MSEFRSLILSDQESDLWDSFINISDNATVFHQLDWLKVAEKHSQMKLFLLVVYKGTKLVCLCPLFLSHKYRLKVLLSPPNGCGIPFLGPVFNIPASNRYNYERTYNEILEEIISFSENQIRYDYFGMTHTPEIRDIRSYKNKGFSINPCYTYRFNLQKGQEWILDNFNKAARNILKKAKSYEKLSVSHEKNNAYNILELLQTRYAEQNLTFKINHSYIDLLLASPIKDNIEVISAICQNHVVAGDIVLVFKEKAYVWQRAVKREDNVAGTGELILWEKIKELIQRGIEYYDFVGANTPHICRHKSKYGADLIPYFDVVKTTIKGKIALKLLNLSKKRVILNTIKKVPDYLIKSDFRNHET